MAFYQMICCRCGLFDIQAKPKGNQITAYCVCSCPFKISPYHSAGCCCWKRHFAGSTTWKGNSMNRTFTARKIWQLHLLRIFQPQLTMQILRMSKHVSAYFSLFFLFYFIQIFMRNSNMLAGLKESKHTTILKISL